jgi:hypothetical protein
VRVSCRQRGQRPWKASIVQVSVAGAVDVAVMNALSL